MRPVRPQKMLVRRLRPLDVVALASFQRRAGGTEITAHNWPRVEPDSRRVTYLNLVYNALAHRPGGQRGWVAEQAAHVVGLAVARPSAGGLVWDLGSIHAARGGHP